MRAGASVAAAAAPAGHSRHACAPACLPLTHLPLTHLPPPPARRYCPQELLNANYHHLDKADIFGLGATLYELATGAEMPKGGPGYQRLRQGKLALLPHCSRQFQDLLKVRCGRWGLGGDGRGAETPGWRMVSPAGRHQLAGGHLMPAACPLAARLRAALTPACLPRPTSPRAEPDARGPAAAPRGRGAAQAAAAEQEQQRGLLSLPCAGRLSCWPGA